MILEKIWKAVTKDMRVGDLILVLLMISLLLFMYNMKIDINEKMSETNATINETKVIIEVIDARYYDDIYDKGATVMNTLVDQGLLSHIEIRDYLASKPAGRSDLKKALNTPETCDRLLEAYGEIVNVAKRAVDF